MDICELLGALDTGQRLLTNTEQSLVFHGGEIGRKLRNEVDSLKSMVTLIRTKLARRENIPQPVYPGRLQSCLAIHGAMQMNKLSET
jgi:hypothetical protein